MDPDANNSNRSLRNLGCFDAQWARPLLPAWRLTRPARSIGLPKMAEWKSSGPRSPDEAAELRSDRSRQVLAQHARVPRCDSQQGQRRSLRAPTTLFPVAQRMDADSESVGELLLSQSDEASKGDDIIAPCKLSAKDTLALFPRHRTGEVPVGQLTNLVAHVLTLSNSSKRWRSFLVAMRALKIRKTSSSRSV